MAWLREWLCVLLLVVAAAQAQDPPADDDAAAAGDAAGDDAATRDAEGEGDEEAWQYVEFLKTEVNEKVELILQETLYEAREKKGLTVLEETVSKTMEQVMEIRESLLVRIKALRKDEIETDPNQDIKQEQMLSEFRMEIMTILLKLVDKDAASIDKLKEISQDLLRFKMLISNEIMRMLMLPDTRGPATITPKGCEECNVLRNITNKFENLVACADKEEDEEGDAQEQEQEQESGAGPDDAPEVECMPPAMYAMELIGVNEMIDEEIKNLYNRIVTTTEEDERQKLFKKLEDFKSLRDTVDDMITKLMSTTEDDKIKKLVKRSLGRVINQVQTILKDCLTGCGPDVECESCAADVLSVAIVKMNYYKQSFNNTEYCCTTREGESRDTRGSSKVNGQEITTVSTSHSSSSSELLALAGARSSLQIKHSLSSPQLAPRKGVAPPTRVNIDDYPDVMALYRHIPSLRLNIENLSRHNKLPPMDDIHQRRSRSFILCRHKWHCAQYAILLGFFRTFAASFVLKTSLSLLQNALFGRLDMTKFKAICTSQDSLLFAHFIGLMSFSYKATLCALRRYFKFDCLAWKSIAGFVCGFWVILDNPQRQRSNAMNGLTRALGDAIKVAVCRGQIAVIPYFNMGCFALSQVVLLNAMFWRSQLVQPTLYRFFLKIGNMNHQQIQALRNRVSATNAGHTHFVPCSPTLHANPSCVGYVANDFCVSMKRASVVYLAVHFLPPLLFQPKRVLLNTRTFVRRGLRNTLMSCLFVSCYNAVVKANVCLLRNVLRADYWWNCVLSALIGSMALLIEDSKRRTELTLYCVPKAIAIILRLFGKRTWPKMHAFLRSTSLRVVAFQLCMAILLTVRAIPKGMENANRLNMTILNLIFGRDN